LVTYSRRAEYCTAGRSEGVSPTSGGLDFSGLARKNDGTRVPDLDRRVNTLLSRGSVDEATTLVLEEVGPEIFRYLVARLRNVAVASDAFSRFSENVWVGLAGFAGRSTLRVWAYSVARNAAGQEIRSDQRHRAHRGNFSDTMASKVADRVRTSTIAWQRTDVKDQFAELQQELDEDERELLFLRINQKLAWDEIARVRAAEDVSDADLKREAARLRKRFQLTREKLRKLASERGLLDENGPWR
jgi:RNA polymerase sigma-70 factor (ECF subfamily)